MSGWKRYLPVLLLTSIAPLLLWGIPSESSGGRRSAPRDIKGVKEIAQKLGLHCRADQENGRVFQRLLISEAPLTRERVNALFVGSQVSADWLGTVAVFRSLEGVGQTPEQDMTVWGKFLLYGDPSLVKRLTESPDS
jgi:hypothetical protein